MNLCCYLSLLNHPQRVMRSPQWVWTLLVSVSPFVIQRKSIYTGKNPARPRIHRMPAYAGMIGYLWIMTATVNSCWIHGRATWEVSSVKLAMGAAGLAWCSFAKASDKSTGSYSLRMSVEDSTFMIYELWYLCHAMLNPRTEEADGRGLCKGLVFEILLCVYRGPSPNMENCSMEVGFHNLQRPEVLFSTLGPGLTFVLVRVSSKDRPHPRSQRPAVESGPAPRLGISQQSSHEGSVHVVSRVEMRSK